MPSLIDRYVYAVTKLLPAGQRDDVARELRASIEDMASDYAKNGKPTQADITKVLTELGDPAILAGKYSGSKQYLIGPKWFPHYRELLKTMLMIVPGIVIAVLLTLNIAQGTMTVGQIIVDSFGAGTMVAINICFWLTLIFAIAERSGVSTKDFDFKESRLPWTPDQLPKDEPKRQISIVDAASSAILMAIGIAWVALSPILHTKDGHPLFNPDLASFWAPAFFVLAGLALLHQLWQLKEGNWTTPLMVTNVLLGVLGITFVLVLVATQQIVNPAYIAAWEASGFEKLGEVVRWSVGITTATVVVVYAWESLESIIKNRRFIKK